MENNSERRKTDVFEMIIKSTGDGYTFNPVKKQEDYNDTSGFGFAPHGWHNEAQEGQLSIDVINTDENIVVMSTMAGADVGKIEVYIHNDLLTIRGVRPRPAHLVGASYLYQECFWGRFSRTVVLPVDVRGDSARAEYKNGVLTIIVPKRQKDSRIAITIVED